MLDIRLFRDTPETVREGLANRGEPTEIVDQLRSIDEQRRLVAAQRDDVRAAIRVISREVGDLFKSGQRDAAEEKKAESRELATQEQQLSEQEQNLANEINAALLTLPNMPAPETPIGAGEHDNVIGEIHGAPPTTFGDHQRVPHWDIGTELGILDTERAVKMSGSMFAMYRGAGAQLARALCSLALDTNRDAFEEVRPPSMVKTDTMIATGHLPKFRDEAYEMERDNLWAIPTAEVPLTSLAREEVLPEAALPMRLMAYTACFRREAGSAGKDTRGLLRVHEFDKVELLAYCAPHQAPAMHQEILDRAVSLITALGLTYRILDLCTGDIGNSAARTFDIEVYAPGCDQWLEVSSVSWFTDYQARRAQIRYRPTEIDGEKQATQYVHTLNGSGLAVPRVWAALVETGRQPDGTILLPPALHPYMGATIGPKSVNI